MKKEDNKKTEKKEAYQKPEIRSEAIEMIVYGEGSPLYIPIGYSPWLLICCPD